MKFLAHIVLAFLLLAAPSVASTVSPVEIRFCPASHLFAYPLDAEGKIKSLLLHSFTIINHGSKAVEVRSVRIDLLRGGESIDSRTLTPTDIKRWAGNAPGLQGVRAQAPFEFCGDEMVDPSVTLAGPVLARNQGLMIMRQVFAFDHARDAVRVRVEAESSGHKVLSEATIAISDGLSTTHFVFPLNGTSYVGWGPSFHTDHRWHPPESFGLDIARLGGDARTYHGDGLKFEDYYAYGADVLAAADGTVIKVVSNKSENPEAIQRPGETAQAYAARHVAEQMQLLGVSQDEVVGNYVMLDHGHGEFSLYAHLQPNNIRVRVGDHLKAGEVLGKLGSSGNSTEPHLHFQVCDRPDPLLCSGIPVTFSNISILWADGPRALQSADIVTTH